MNIGLVIWSLFRTKGGIERLGVGIAEEMNRRGHTVVLFHNDPYDACASPCYPLSQNIQTISLGLHSEGNVQTARKRIISCDLDVFCVMISWDALLWFPALLNNTGIPLLISEHNHPEIIEKERWNAYEHTACMAGADGIHILNKNFLRFFPEFLRERITVISNPAPKAHMVDWAKREHAPRKSLLAVGRLVESHKQFSLLIKAFALLHEQFPDWDLHICGDGKDKFTYKSLIGEMHLEGRAFLDGEVSDVDARYASSHVFCMPSRYEGFGLVTTEAQSHALPVVGFAQCTGTNEIIIHGENGILVEAMTPPALAAGLRTLMEAPAARRSLGERGQALLARYEAEGVYNQWEAMLRKTCDRKGKTRLNFSAPSEEEATEIALREILCRTSPFARPTAPSALRQAQNRESRFGHIAHALRGAMAKV